ncbi:hypothetical protein JAAARDRAFT_290864 [Jaapia argillacea MUCL 33604]|uniref:Uncharacterized protein n=1 Tax=Jaapia argillacea MUCL 33604 TaxID=933084 RepID=A0A067Q190_9AGAM|nr:hypothetical protein JAAARDRAFT_290864 [Jaapia argillacea MUCL 33604]
MNFVWGLLDYYVFNRLLNVRIVSDDLFSDDDDTRADPSSSLRAHSRRGRRETTRLLEQTTPEQAESPTTSIVIPSSSVRGLRADRDRIDHGITRTLTASPEEQRRRMRSNSLWDRSHQQHTTQHRDLERRGTTIGVGASVGASVGAGATNAGAGVGPRADPVVTFAEDAQREREKERRGSRELRQELELQKEKDCLTIQSLQSENASLQTKINALQSSLNGSIAQLTTLQSQHLALRRQHDELRRSHDALQLKHSHFTALAQSHASTSTDLSRMTARYDGLRKAYGDLAREAEDGKEELKSLRGFLNRTDEWSGAQIIQNVQDLNGEAVQLAASIADEFCSASITPGPGAGGMSFAPRSLPSSPPRPRARSRTTSTSIQSSSGSHFHLLLPRNSSTELVQQTLSEPLLALLHSHDHSSDPTLVQFAIQAWLVKCCTLVFEAFYFGLDDKVDGLLKEMWEDICRTEPQPTASRWRALTYNLTRASTANLPTSSSSRPHHHAADSISNLTNTFILGSLCSEHQRWRGVW